MVFGFLNSLECINLQGRDASFGEGGFYNNEWIKTVKADIEDYENSMIAELYMTILQQQHFSFSNFLCVGAAHRKSIIQKIEKYEKEQGILSWDYFWKLNRVYK